MNLLIDIGNSRLKWGLKQGDCSEIVSGTPIHHQQNNIQQQLVALWSEIETPEYIAISSVVANRYIKQINHVAKKYWPDSKLIIAKSLPQGFGVVNAYQQAENLGIDRWLTLIALRRYFRLPACVVDCGTALTVDVLDKQGMHLGGLITPGLEIMKQSLSQGTKNLKWVDKEKYTSLAKTTETAIFSGTLLTATGLIEKVMRQQHVSPNLLLTGGDAALIAKHLSVKAAIEPNLVLMGLSVMLENQV